MIFGGEDNGFFYQSSQFLNGETYQVSKADGRIKEEKVWFMQMPSFYDEESNSIYCSDLTSNHVYEYNLVVKDWNKIDILAWI